MEDGMMEDGIMEDGGWEDGRMDMKEPKSIWFHNKIKTPQSHPVYIEHNRHRHQPPHHPTHYQEPSFEQIVLSQAPLSTSCTTQLHNKALKLNIIKYIFYTSPYPSSAPTKYVRAKYNWLNSARETGAEILRRDGGYPKKGFE